MGIARYNRGSRALSDQVDREQAEKPRRTIDYLAYSNAMEHTRRLQGQIASLEADMERARAALARARAALSVERDEWAAERDRLKSLAREHAKSSLRHRLNWERCSKIIRSYVTPAQVEEFRQEHPRKPTVPMPDFGPEPNYK